MNIQKKNQGSLSIYLTKLQKLILNQGGLTSSVTHCQQFPKSTVQCSPN